MTLSPDTLLGLGVGVVGLGFAAWLRSARTSTRTLTPPTPQGPPEPPGVMLMGKYNAGPRPAPAEKFEIGPTYNDVQQEKKRTEEENQQAVLEFILAQNIALYAEIAGPDPAREADAEAALMPVDAVGPDVEPVATLAPTAD